MQLNYNTSHTDENYLGRVFLFAKRNYWIFILDFILILFLAVPPYSREENVLLLIMFAILFIRDFIILRISYKHLGKFIARGNNVLIGILRKSKFQDDIAEWLPDIELELKYKFGIPILFITSGPIVIFKQYPIGIWTIDKMKEFIDSFYDYKKEQALWKIYKGQE
ncbi:MAG: hypothetical protein PF485_05090 [Bacteroidales bacterium]|jgi:hypothetical protein|nr:hypothetical protein [Bacteroidales bacterium]